MSTNQSNPQETGNKAPQATAPKTAKKRTKKMPAYFTKEGYEVSEDEKDFVHVVTSKFTLNRGDFEKTTHETTHIIDPKTWEMVRKIWPGQGMKFVEMLHYPAGASVGFPNTKKER